MNPTPKRPTIGISLGDPRGIGREITSKALREMSLASTADFLVVGPSEFVSAELPGVAIGEWGGGFERAGELAGLAIQRVAEMALHGEVDAIVTAPIDKAALHAGGWDYPGHTEMLKEITGVPDVAMMMVTERTLAGRPLRVVLATTHIALRDVPAAVTADLLVRQSRLTHDALRAWWGIETPQIALCAFNPHASDGGLFGDEETRVMQPALDRLVSEGITAVGPLPADTVFRRAIEGEFDAVVAPYHDVGMAAFKTVSFGSGVNVTPGLPFPRTSPDHGTAIDIAGRDIANPSSMIEAIRLAIRLTERFDTTRNRV